MKKIAIFPGDGIGPEIVDAARLVLDAVDQAAGLNLQCTDGLVGGAALDATDDPLPEASLQLAMAADAVILGAVGGPRWDGLPPAKRPEQGLLRLRKNLDLFANLRPAQIFPQLLSASPLRPELVRDVDILVVRELTGDIYFGQPRAVELVDGKRRAYNTMVYDEDEIRRIAHVAFKAAQGRRKQLCSVDKANVLETTRLWREVVTELAAEYPDVHLTHMYVDNAAMQLIRAPSQFDVLLTGNMFGDILSDEASQLTPSAKSCCKSSSSASFPLISFTCCPVVALQGGGCRFGVSRFWCRMRPVLTGPRWISACFPPGPKSVPNSRPWRQRRAASSLIIPPSTVMTTIFPWWSRRSIPSVLPIM